MIGYGIVILARGLNRDPGEAFVLSALNPLVLLTLIGGAHNDAIMAGFLVVGIALAVKRHPIWALFFCSCAAAIKAPAAIGLAFVAWTWLGPKASIRERLRPIAIACGVAAATLGVWTFLAGFGFGWVENLLSNGTVRSWAAPATAVGLAFTNTMHAIGWHTLADRFSDLGDASHRSARRGGLRYLAPVARRRAWLGTVLGPLADPLRRTWSGRPAVVPRVGAGPVRRELQGTRTLLAPRALDNRSVHWYARWSGVAGRPRALEPAPHRGRGRGPRRRAVAADGALDAVVLARIRTRRRAGGV